MCSCTRVVLIHELLKIPNFVCVFHDNEIHNNESTPTDISTLLTTLSSLGISISTILCYSSYFGLIKIKVIIFVLALHLAFYSIINFGGWILELLSGVLLSSGTCPAVVSLINIHEPCLSVYVQASEILYIVNIQKYKLRMLTNTPILSYTL